MGAAAADGIIKKHAEVVTWASVFGLVVPVTFVWLNPSTGMLRAVFTILIVLPIVVHFLLSSRVLNVDCNLHAGPVRAGLYIWSVFVLIASANLIWETGGMGRSIFVWLLEYGIIVVLLVRDGKWRPVLTVVGLVVLLISVLWRHECGVMDWPPHRVPEGIAGSALVLWGAISAVGAIGSSIVTFFLAGVADR